MLSTNLRPQTSWNQKLMMLTPDDLTTNQSEECPRLSTRPTTPSLILVLKTFPGKPPGCCAFWALAAWTCCLAPAINAAAFSFSTTWCPLTGFTLHGWRTQVWSRNTFTFILLFEPPWPNKCRKRKVTCLLLSSVWLCDPSDCRLPGSSVHGILQARIPEWVAISFSRGPSWPRVEPRSSALAGGFFTIWARAARKEGAEAQINPNLWLWPPRETEQWQHPPRPPTSHPVCVSLHKTAEEPWSRKWRRKDGDARRLFPWSRPSLFKIPSWVWP